MKIFNVMKKMTGVCLLVAGVSISAPQYGMAAHTAAPIVTTQTTEASAQPEALNEILMQDNVWITAKPSVEDTYFKIQIPKAGYIRIDHENEADRIAIFKICNEEKQVLSSDYFVNDYRYYPVRAGVYYIKTKGAYGTDYKLKYTYEKELKLKKDTELKVYPEVYYLKYTASRDEEIMLENKEEFVNMRLCDEKKKTLVPTMTVSDSMSYYLKANKTYYFRMEVYNKRIHFTYRTFKYKANQNISKTKASALRKNNAKRMRFVPGEKGSYWYKITLKNKQRIRIGCNREVYPVLYKANGKTKVKVTQDRNYDRLIMVYTTSKAKLPKGTYYVKLNFNGKESYDADIEWLHEYK